MLQQTKIAIPLGETGSICFFEGELNSFQNQNLKEKELKSNSILSIYMIGEENNFDRIKSNFSEFNFHLCDSSETIDFFDTVLSENSDKNISITCSREIKNAVLFIAKLLLANDPTLDSKELFSYLDSNFPNIEYHSEIENFKAALEKNLYHIRKQDKAKLNVIFETNFNLSALDMPLSDESMFETNPHIDFNLDSLRENPFEEEKTGSFTDESNALDINLSTELDFIESIEEPSNVSEVEKVILISTSTLEDPEKEYIDFNAILDEEIEDGMQAEEFSFGENSLHESDFFSNDLNDKAESKISEMLTEEFDFQGDSQPILKDEAKFQNTEELKEDFDPSQTYISKRIHDLIKNEVLIEKIKTEIKFNAIELDE